MLNFIAIFLTSFVEQISSWFVYNPQNPMIFSNPMFWAFFLVAMVAYYFIYARITARNMFLLAFSLFFYYKTGGFFFFLIIFSTFVDYYIGEKVHRSTHEPTRTWLVVLSLIVNLGLLAYFKYTFYFIDIINSFGADVAKQDYLAATANGWFGTSLDISKIILPVGISFYTFQTISYTLDIYRRKIEPVDNILDFGFFVSFFPQLVAGPIVRAADFVPQIYQPYKLNAQEYGYAIFLIINGLIKKILISDYISTNFVDRVFASPERFSGFENLMAVYGYAIQIYCDFSGYTDIAIGLALLLGFRLNINFNSPYSSTSITDFWRRWHISLSSWLRDYLYISLGGNRTASKFTYMSVPLILLIFLLIDGWTGLNFMFFMMLITVWILSLAFPETKFIGVIGVLVGTTFAAQTFVDGAWYSFGLLCMIILFWVLLLVRPDKKQSVSTYMNLTITMLLGGLWHGADTRFIIWGALHGGALALHKFWMDITGSKDKKPSRVSRFVGQLITFHFVCFCWIYFRAQDMTTINKIFAQMADSFQFAKIPEMIGGYADVFGLMALAYAIHWLPRNLKNNLNERFTKMPDILKAMIISIVVIILYQASTSAVKPFIYFQF